MSKEELGKIFDWGKLIGLLGLIISVALGTKAINDSNNKNSNEINLKIQKVIDKFEFYDYRLDKIEKKIK
jgi:hypothetical protein